MTHLDIHVHTQLNQIHVTKYLNLNDIYPIAMVTIEGVCLVSSRQYKAQRYYLLLLLSWVSPGPWYINTSGQCQISHWGVRDNISCSLVCNSITGTSPPRQNTCQSNLFSSQLPQVFYSMLPLYMPRINVFHSIPLGHVLHVLQCFVFGLDTMPSPS